MIEAFTGLVGGGKTYCAINRAMNYIARGGRVVTNIKLVGWSEFCGAFCPGAPVLEELKNKNRWEYQQGQYIYISFDDMVNSPYWINRVPAGPSRDKRNLLIIDEATDLFDSFDREKVRGSDGMRELFRFLRLSRHVHVDVLFIAQDLSAINSRLRGLVHNIWRSTNMSEFRLPFFKVKMPLGNWFLLQQFDRRGTSEVLRRHVVKRQAIFGIYKSEAFSGDVGISSDGIVIADGNIQPVKETKKMNVYERVLGFVGLVLVGVSLKMQVKYEKMLNQIASRPVPVQQTIQPQKILEEQESKKKQNDMIIKPWVEHTETKPAWKMSDAGFKMYSPEIKTGYIIEGIFYFLGARVPLGVVDSLSDQAIVVLGADGSRVTFLRFLGAPAE